MCRQNSLNSSLRSVPKQCEVEIARDGVSYTTLPPKQSKEPKTSILLYQEHKQYVAATLLIAKTLNEAQSTRNAIEIKIHHDSKMAQQRLIRGNDRGACLSMRRVVIAQYEYVYILQQIAAIIVLHYSLENGFVGGRKTKKYIHEILSMPKGDKPTEYDDEDLLNQLERGDFFPILNAESGAITFTASYDYASSLEVALRPNESPRLVF